MSPATLQKKLLRWYAGNSRQDLPWRKVRSPYRTLVSEAMLQQTQVETVIPYFRRFLSRFPTLKQLSRAEPGEVLALWSGLGYYSRARNLHACARAIQSEHAGRAPQDPVVLLGLPGIGRYTAGAIASIAYGRPVPLVDGNVNRVLARLFGVRGSLQTPAAQKRIWGLATRLVPERSAGDFNQALMDLGALLCTPKNPDCAACPLRDGCWAKIHGRQEQIPPPRRPVPKKPIRYLCVRIERRGKLLLARRPFSGLLGGLWELPGGEAAGAAADEATELQALLKKRLGIPVRIGKLLGSRKQTLTHRWLEIRCFAGSAASGTIRPESYVETIWTEPERLGGLGLTTGMRKLLATL